MKIISLNIWGGKIWKELSRFLKKYNDVDIFLLQEVFHGATDITAWDETDRKEVFKEISQLLPNHRGYYAPAESDEWGLALFAKKTLSIQEHGDIFVYGKKNSMVRKDASTLGKNLQYLKISYGDKNYTIMNFHGLWNGRGKRDTPERIEQSKRIIDFIKTLPHDIILCGDFNLRPDTESLKMIEKELGLINLISRHGIISTRTSLYKKSEKFADYALISPSIKVKDFKILPDEVSDHAALFLEF